MDFPVELRRYVDRVEQGIDRFVPPAETRPARLHTAMRYSLEAGGKRLRPVLVLATADLFGAGGEAALPAAVAIECIHTYSLIHDDLPCMDNDDLRRGRPTVHKAFDEATALLAGDALLTHAFAVIAQSYAEQPLLTGQLIREFADAAGSRRLVGGQMEDLLAEKKNDVPAGDLEFIHLNKTAAMIEASLLAGGLVGAASEKQLSVLRRVGRHLGLAFQIVDDILDATSDSVTLGKTAGKDARSDKTTYVKIHGLVASRKFARQHTESATAELRGLPGEKLFLEKLIASMAERVK